MGRHGRVLCVQVLSGDKAAHGDCCDRSSKQHHYEHTPELQKRLAEDETHARPPRKLWVTVGAWPCFDHRLETHSVARVLESIVGFPFACACCGWLFCQA